MARVRSIAPGTQSVNVHPSEVDCFWQTIEDSRGEVFVHLSTFGSDTRQSKPKSSQSLQLDQTQAAELIAVLRRVFPELGQPLPAPVSQTSLKPVEINVDTSNRMDSMAAELLASRVFQAQWRLAGRVSLTTIAVAGLVGRLVAAPSHSLPNSAIATHLGVAETRLPGAIATLQKVMNVEGYPVLLARDSVLILDVQLLDEQFRLETRKVGALA